MTDGQGTSIVTLGIRRLRLLKTASWCSWAAAPEETFIRRWLYGGQLGRCTYSVNRFKVPSPLSPLLLWERDCVHQAHSSPAMPVFFYMKHNHCDRVHFERTTDHSNGSKCRKFSRQSSSVQAAAEDDIHMHIHVNWPMKMVLINVICLFFIVRLQFR